VQVFGIGAFEFTCGQGHKWRNFWTAQWRTSRCTWPRRHYGFSGFNVSPAAAAGERCRSAAGVAGW